ELLERAREPRVSGEPALEAGALRQDIADVYTELEVMRLHGLRSLTTILGGHEPGSESSIAKIQWGLADRKLHNLALAVQGPAGPGRAGPPGDRPSPVRFPTRAVVDHPWRHGADPAQHHRGAAAGDAAVENSPRRMAEGRRTGCQWPVRRPSAILRDELAEAL